MQQRIRTDPPNGGMRGYKVRDSSNVSYVAWQGGDMYVIFRDGSMYRYEGVSRQRVVACALAVSVGRYLSAKIKPHFKAVKLA